jgi:hypothetical protein
MVIGVDPVGHRFARSLARPGGNVTGLDTLTALSAEKLIPETLAVCSRNHSYAELISAVNSYLHKGLGSEKTAVKEAMRITPVPVWIVRLYTAKCDGSGR